MRVELFNALGFLVALGLAMLGGGMITERGEHSTSRLPPGTATAVVPERAPDGSLVLRDARGALVPLTSYRRIASGSLLADRVLADLCEPERIVAFTRYAARLPDAHRYVGKPTLSARDDVEQVLSLKPELLLASDLVEVSYLARLREHGVRVFDLGPMRGLETLLPNIRAIGVLIGAPERADRYAAALERRLGRVALPVAARSHPRALYLSVYGDRLFGSARHTSYHDMIEYAGLRDAAARAGLSGWPELSGEQVLALAPDVVITRTGMGDVVCRHPGLEQLAACRADAVIELDGALLDDPGPGLLDATEALFAAYWRL